MNAPFLPPLPPPLASVNPKMTLPRRLWRQQHGRRCYLRIIFWIDGYISGPASPCPLSTWRSDGISSHVTRYTSTFLTKANTKRMRSPLRIKCISIHPLTSFSECTTSLSRIILYAAQRCRYCEALKANEESNTVKKKSAF